MLGLVITTDGKMYKKEFTRPLYRSIGEVTGGRYMEHVCPVLLPRPFCILIDEEGLLKEDPVVNVIGSLWYNAWPNMIVGNIVVMKDGWCNGERDILGLTKEECDAIINLVYEMSDEQVRLVKEPDHEVL